jgi:hypothetical protein
MAMERACESGAVPFEVIAGAPFARYGVRVTFQHQSPAALARVFGFETHAWGAPDWVGVRVRPDGTLVKKAYHRLEVLDGRFTLPAGWPGDLYPIMASLDGDAVEVYLRKWNQCSFDAFAERCLAVLGPASPRPQAVPYPRPRDHAFCVSLRRERGRVAAVSLYADWRALPRDSEIEQSWSEGLGDEDRTRYRLAVAGVRSLGFLPLGNWHAMLAWTVEADGELHRAVSLTVPPRFRAATEAANV